MPSFIWKRDPQEAYRNPYEYEAQEQFVREAKRILDGLFNELFSDDIVFTRDERTKDKAIWMLLVDALDSLRDCIELLKEERHRIAARVFRDVIELLDLIAVFVTNTMESNKLLQQWYEDQIISNRECRKYLLEILGQEAIEKKRKFYRMISKLTHRTYRTLAYGYVLGKNNKLVYEGQYQSLPMVPHTISMYLALLASFIKLLSRRIKQLGLISEKRVTKIWNDSLEKHSVPRRFEPLEETVTRLRND